jgi:hypothetical protein
MSKTTVYIQEPNFEPEEGEVYGEILDALNGAGIRHMLGGTIALNAYTGVWRDAKDLDLFVPEKTVARVLETLGASDFETGLRIPAGSLRRGKGNFSRTSSTQTRTAPCQWRSPGLPMHRRSRSWGDRRSSSLPRR